MGTRFQSVKFKDFGSFFYLSHHNLDLKAIIIIAMFPYLISAFFLSISVLRSPCIYVTKAQLS